MYANKILIKSGNPILVISILAAMPAIISYFKAAMAYRWISELAVFQQCSHLMIALDF